MTYKNILSATALLISCIASINTYAARPGDYIYTPTVEEGEKEIDFKMGTEKSKDAGTPRSSAGSIGFGYGVNSWWFTEVYGKFERNGNTTRFDATEWENKFQLTETGKYPVDIGVLLELERPQDRAEGYETRYGLLLQSDWQKWQANVNILLEKKYPRDESNTWAMGYQGQVKYRYQETLEFGAQAIIWSNTHGTLDNPSDSEKKIGPAIFGKFKLAPGQAIKYNAGFLFGCTKTSPNTTFRTQVEYEF